MKPPTRTHVSIYPRKRWDGKQEYEVRWSEGRGRPMRRIFSDPAKAEREADYLEDLHHKGMRIVGRLTLEELSGVALMLANIPNVPPHEVIQFYKQSHGLNGIASERSVPLRNACAQFIRAKQEQERKRALSEAQVRALRQHTDRLCKVFGDREVTTISLVELKEYVRDNVSGAAKTRWNHITTLRSLGRWMRERMKWFPLSLPTPFEELEKPGWKAGKKELYTPDELTRLLVFTPKTLLGFLVIGAFGGVRAAERTRITSEHWVDEHKQLTLTDDITKTEKERIVDAANVPNLEAWVRVLDMDNGIVADRHHLYRETAKIAKAAGVPWKRNALRYSFVSYHQQLMRQPALTAMLAGHTVNQADTAYKKIGGVNDLSATSWFAITPASVCEFAEKEKLVRPEWAERIKTSCPTI